MIGTMLLAIACQMSVKDEEAAKRVPTVIEFQSPARQFAPYLWWHWMNGNVSKEGITADLEAMADAGFGGAHMFDSACGIPAGHVRFHTGAWYDAIRHAVRESGRLGLHFGLANCSGWANSGGPWVKPEESMKYVHVSETRVTGPRHFDAVLPRTQDDHGFYEDIAVVAVREKPAPEYMAHTVISGNCATVTCDRPVRITGFRYQLQFGWTYGGIGTGTLELSHNGTDFEPPREMPVTIAYFNTSLYGWHNHVFEKPIEAKALRFRVVFAGRPKLVITKIALDTETRLEELEKQTLRVKAPIDKTKIDYAPIGVIDDRESLVLTDKVDAAGRLVWDVPEGDWTILRIGYAANGMMLNGENTEGGAGLEVDKLDAKAVERHFDAYVGKVKRMMGAAGAACDMVLNDSYEAESQNWVRGFERTFHARCGYDLTPFLPVLAGRVVRSVRDSETFLADYRKTLIELFAENYAGTLQRKSHEWGMAFYAEPYGNGPLDESSYTRYTDVPMCEFWSTSATGRNSSLSTGFAVGNVEDIVKEAVRWNKRIVGAEAFTTGPGPCSGRLMTTPYALKCQGDRAFERGVNRLFIHGMSLQPWTPTRYPGMTFGKYGVHFDRTQTWWTEAKEYVRYLTRCQYLLQIGTRDPQNVAHRYAADADWFFVPSIRHETTTVEKRFPIVGRVPEVWDPEQGTVCRARTWRVEKGETVVALTLRAAASLFVMFHEKGAENLPLEAAWRETDAQSVVGPWHVAFKSPAGGEPPARDWEKLMDWSTSSERALRFFSGSATYEKTIRVKPGADRYVLDLGCVMNFATVTANGKTYPALWKPPFEQDVTDVIGPDGTLKVSVRVTNLWPNRLIGDAALPETERGTYITWEHWKKTDKPLSSGLLGPVHVKTYARSEDK